MPAEPVDGPRPRLSVVVCSHRRPFELAQCLATLEANWDDVDDEVVVVDIAPDGDDAERLLSSTPLVHRRVGVGAVGLGAARNAGWRAARGDVVVFVDDGARVAPGTLAAYRRAFRGAPDLDAAGGPIRLAWPGASAPTWYSGSLAPVFSGLEPTTAATAAARPLAPNMAVRRSGLERIDGFDERLARGGADVDRGEATELCARLEADNRRLAMVADAVVVLRVPPERARVGWVLQQATRQGRADVAVSGTRGRRAARLLGASLAGATVRGWGNVWGSRHDAASARPVLVADAGRRARRAGRAVAAAGRLGPR